MYHLNPSNCVLSLSLSFLAKKVTILAKWVTFCEICNTGAKKGPHLNCQGKLNVSNLGAKCYFFSKVNLKVKSGSFGFININTYHKKIKYLKMNFTLKPTGHKPIIIPVRVIPWPSIWAEITSFTSSFTLPNWPLACFGNHYVLNLIIATN